MRTERLYARSKRRRTVHLEKAAIFTAVFVFAAFLSILGNQKLVSAHDSHLEQPAGYRYYKSIQVNAGDSLWSIAEEYMNDECESVPEYIEVLKEINHLDSDEIHEGRYLTIAYTDQEFR